MYSAQDIANWFLAANRGDLTSGVSDENISLMKLQNLLYYAQGVYLALRGTILFSEDILAYKKGALIEEIQAKYEDFKTGGIEFDGVDDFKEIDSETAGILEDVYKHFGQYSAWRLREMVCEEEPWKIAWGIKPQMAINIESIKKYFEENHVEKTKRSNMYSAQDIVNWFLARNRLGSDLEASDEQLSNLKLQNLLYYAQGLNLAINGVSLFCENIFACNRGAVVPEIYEKYKEFGAGGIVFEGVENFKEIDAETEDILEQTYVIFGQFSAWKLREMVCTETPWIVANGAKLQIPINIENIKNYFQEHYVE